MATGLVLSLLATLFIQVLVAYAALVAPVLAPPIAADLGLDPHLIGLFVSLVYGIAACSGLVSGGFIHRYGAMRVSQACLVLAALSMAVLSVGTLPALILAALAIGAGYGPVTPASSAILARGTPQAWLNLVFSIKQTGVPLGFMLAGVALPALTLWAGWRVASLIGTGICLVFAIALEPMRAETDRERDPMRPVLSLGHVLRPLRVVFATPAIRRLAFASFVFAGMQSSLSTFLVTFLNRDLGMPLVAAGIVLATSQVGATAGRILWGIVADRLVPPMTVLGGLGLAMGLFALLTGMASATWPFAVLIAVSVCFGATAGAWNGVHLAQLARLAPAGQAGEVTGGTFFLTFGGVMATPSLFSLVLGLTDSFLVGYALVGGIAASAGLSILLLRKPTS
ncbi:MAG: MFS transporter [Proteobacteria bacterium]|nr:MFS transporter [Pseudomonadota bacterium]MBI3497416.1 MFS transporter [Pseudomonadota bacterium]